MDQIYDEIKGDYIFPEYHIRAYQSETSFRHQPTDVTIFDELYTKNCKSQTNIRGHHTGIGSSTFRALDLQKADQNKQTNAAEGQIKVRMNNMELGKETITQFIDHEIMRKLKHDFSIELLL